MVVEMCGGVDTAFALIVQSVSTEMDLRIVLHDGRGQTSSNIGLVRSKRLRGREVSSQLLATKRCWPPRSLMTLGFAIVWLPVNRDLPIMPARIYSEIRRTAQCASGVRSSCTRAPRSFR